MMNDLINICHLNLKNSKKHLDYAKKRISGKNTVEHNKIGFFPQNLEILKKYINEEFLSSNNIVSFSNNSDFSLYNNFIIPIFDEWGRAVGISGRSLNTEQEMSLLGISKYKNSSYKKSKILFGLDKSKDYIIEKNNAYVVEGYFDYFSMIDNGFKNCVALCGTAFTKSHFLKLSFLTDTITFILDTDESGVKSAKRTWNNFCGRGVKLRFIKLPSGFKDPDEFFKLCEHNDFAKFTHNYIPEEW